MTVSKFNVKMHPLFKNCLFTVRNKYLCYFTMRQGSIIIAVNQIAMASFVLFIHILGVLHVGEMMSILHDDMNDDAEKRGFTEITSEGKVAFHEGVAVSNNNQKQFAKAHHIATETVVLLYTSTVLTMVYLLCSVLLLIGAIWRKRGFVVPWLVTTSVALVLTMLLFGNVTNCVVETLGGSTAYYVMYASFLIASLYSFTTVCSFALEDDPSDCRHQDERGEQVLLLDRAAQSSLLTTKQLDKLSLGAAGATSFV